MPVHPGVGGAEAKAVVMAGNLSDGYALIGPFEDLDEAAEWASRFQKNLPGLGDYWLASLLLPIEFETREEVEE